MSKFQNFIQKQTTFCLLEYNPLSFSHKKKQTPLTDLWMMYHCQLWSHHRASVSIKQRRFSRPTSKILKSTEFCFRK
uniref:Uncharacterized protein n=1 Tax=Populus trichocarpa TaxID=3694 RepID=U5G4J8_POPTR